MDVTFQQLFIDVVENKIFAKLKRYCTIIRSYSQHCIYVYRFSPVCQRKLY